MESVPTPPLEKNPHTGFTPLPSDVEEKKQKGAVSEDDARIKTKKVVEDPN